MPWPAANEWPGPECYCGRTGCIESLLSGPALERDFAQATGSRLGAADIVASAAGQNPEAMAMLAAYEERLARALASVINLLDPDVIVLGGGMSNTPSLYANVPKLWGRWVFGAGLGGAVGDGVDTQLLPPVHGDSSGVRGAAWLWGREEGEGRREEPAGGAR
jgi:fructokinase